jgi:hypothetical protein
MDREFAQNSPESVASGETHKRGIGSIRPFKWTRAKANAAVLIAEDELTCQEIADRLQVDRKTIHNWKQRKEFSDQVAEHAKRFGNVLLRYAVAKRARRVRALDDRWLGLLSIIEERAAEAEAAKTAYGKQVANAAGGRTGLIVRRVRGVGKGEDFQLIEEFAVDVPLLKALLDLERQAAQECGQWREKMDVSSSGEPLTLVVGVPDEAI